MKEFGIIGYPLSHSSSPDYFRRKFEKESLQMHFYYAFPIEDIVQIHYLVKHYPFLAGLNVTSPYKQIVIGHLHRIDPIAAEIDSVNVIRIHHHQNTTELTGFNTDYRAFSQSLCEEISLPAGPALIFGTGGAARSAGYAFKKMGIPFRYVSRKKMDGCLTYEELLPEIIEQHTLLINATPAGMFPDVEHVLPIPYEAIGRRHLLMDMIYNPAETSFLVEGKKRGARIKNGEMMFRLQAEMSWEIWNEEIK